MNGYFCDQVFENVDFTIDDLSPGDYEGCRFLRCSFAGITLPEIHFSECAFEGCNLSLVQLPGSTLQDVSFLRCRIAGVHFDACNHTLFTAKYDDCLLEHSSFFGMKLKKANFTSCILRDADFTGADLTEAVFDRCDLERALFEETILEKADFITSFHYTIDPEKNRIKKAKFSTAGLPGLLGRYQLDIH